jgi:hypothetical protein
LFQFNVEKLRDINFCDFDYQKRTKSPKPDKKEKAAEPAPANATKQECACDCRSCGRPPKKTEVNAKADKFLDESLVDTIIDTIFPPAYPSPPDLPPDTGQSREKRSAGTDAGLSTANHDRLQVPLLPNNFT